MGYIFIWDRHPSPHLGRIIHAAVARRMNLNGIEGNWRHSKHSGMSSCVCVWALITLRGMPRGNSGATGQHTGSKPRCNWKARLVEPCLSVTGIQCARSISFSVWKFVPFVQAVGRWKLLAVSKWTITKMHYRLNIDVFQSNCSAVCYNWEWFFARKELKNRRLCYIYIMYICQFKVGRTLEDLWMGIEYS